MDTEPDYTNVHFIDEYPHLEQKLRWKRLAVGRRAVGRVVRLPLTIDGEAATDFRSELRLIMEEPPQDLQ